MNMMAELDAGQSQRNIYCTLRKIWRNKRGNIITKRHVTERKLRRGEVLKRL